jgi:hypothetical protein
MMDLGVPKSWWRRARMGGILRLLRGTSHGGWEGAGLKPETRTWARN